MAGIYGMQVVLRATGRERRKPRNGRGHPHLADGVQLGLELRREWRRAEIADEGDGDERVSAVRGVRALAGESAGHG